MKIKISSAGIAKFLLVTTLIISSIIGTYHVWTHQNDQCLWCYIGGVTGGAVVMIIILITLFFISGIIEGEILYKEWTIDLSRFFKSKPSEELDLLYTQMMEAIKRGDEKEVDKVIIQIEKYKNDN